MSGLVASAVGTVAGAIGGGIEALGGLSTIGSALGIANSAVSLGNQLFGDTPSGGGRQVAGGGGGGNGSGSGGFFQSDLTPQIVKGNTSPIDLTSGINFAPQLSNIPSGPLSYVADGGYIQSRSSHTRLAPGLIPLPLQPKISHGHEMPSLNVSPSDTFNFGSPSTIFDQKPFKSETYAEGGEIEHNPEFYSEGGLKHTYVQGAGDGTSDSVPAMLANGEFVIPADVVSALGNGSSDSGSKVLDELLQTVREHKQNHEPKELPPDSKGALEYIAIAKHRVGGVA